MKTFTDTWKNAYAVDGTFSQNVVVAAEYATTKLKDKEQFELVVENEYDDDKSIKNSSSLEDVEYKSTDKKGNKSVSRAKVTEVWKFFGRTNRQNTTSYKWEVRLVNDIVDSWKELE